MRVRSPGFGLYVVCALAAIFWLPLHVPMQPSGSISYMLGFNNRAALYALLMALAIGGFAVRGLALRAPQGVSVGPSRKTIVVALLVTLAGCLLMTWIASPTWGMDESPYLIGRVNLLLAGQKPYTDFEFIYGPALLYLPAWTARALHMGAGPAYFLVWTCEWLAGVLMAALVVRWLGFARGRANLALWVLLSLFASSMGNTGETYTPFRELAALVAMLAIDRAVRAQNAWRVPMAGALCAALLFCISPEMAVAFIAASSLYLLLCASAKTPAYRTGVRLASLAVTVAIYVLELRLASRAH